MLMVFWSSKLPSDTLAALDEFYAEKDKQQNRLDKLQSDIAEKSDKGELSMNVFNEDWNSSQFWVCN